MSRFTATILSAIIASASFATHSASAQDASKAPAIASVHDEMRRFIDAREIPGAVTLVASPDRIVHLDATGMADIDKNTPMRPDTIFWIASMTKPITATAVLMLQDEGKLSVDDPVEKHIPEFSKLKTASGEASEAHDPPPAHPHLGHGRDSLATESRGVKTLAGLIPLYVAKPVQFAPGSKWTYCQSGINTAARIVEVVSGEPFDRIPRAAAVRPAGDEGHDLLSHRGAAPAARHVVPKDRAG